MSTNNPKRRLFEQLGGLARSLGQAHRLELVEHLSQGPRSVEALAKLTGVSVANASQHLQQLRRYGCVHSHREGQRIIYRLADGSPILQAITALRTLAEHNLAEVRDIVGTYFTALDELEPISREELARRLKDGAVKLLDVRPEDEFELGHLPGAINIPLGKLKSRLSKLPKRAEIIAYCRGPYCVLSFEAVAALRARGFKARRLEDGFPEWKSAGLAVEQVQSR
jgi:rhodanese-related sulfurtransferase/biotin operon repressor